MNFRDYFMGLDHAERAAFAQRAGTSVAYILSAFASTKTGPRKIPQRDLFRRLVEASDGKVSAAELADYFGFATLDELRAHFEAEAVAAREAESDAIAET